MIKTSALQSVLPPETAVVAIANNVAIPSLSRVCSSGGSSKKQRIRSVARREKAAKLTHGRSTRVVSSMSFCVRSGHQALSFNEKACAMEQSKNLQ